MPQATGRAVFVGLSGGVDSAVAALLLKRQGYAVTALFMNNWQPDDHCGAERDFADARMVCERLDIPLTSTDFSEEYWSRVFSRFLDEHRAGRTPNPDVLCNREIKFDLFLRLARQRGADRIATGHYAGVAPGDRWRLLRAADANKDQTYFLHCLGQPELAATLFPLAGYGKAEVRAIARQAGLPVAEKKDSTGICFIGERPFREFLSAYLPEQPGSIRDETGRPLGEHRGLAFYTLGQRQGLGIGGQKGAQGPWFVAGKNTERNELIVVEGPEHPLLFSSELVAEAATWIAGRPPARQFDCTAKTRYRQRDVPCRVEVLDAGRLKVSFPAPQKAATPGQSVVFYDGEACLGGAVIDSTDNPLCLLSHGGSRLAA